MSFNNFSKDPLIPFIATVVSFSEQKEQVEGLGWGYRYKIAVMGDYSQNQSDLTDAQIDYGYCIVPTTAGSGGGNFGKSVHVAQGDIVFGVKVGGKRGISIIIGVFPRTKYIKSGVSRFDSESGFYKEIKPTTLVRRNEINEQGGNPRLPRSKKPTTKQNRQSPILAPSK